MRCRVCGKQNPITFRARILNRYDVAYFHCDHCGFLQTEEPYWHEEAHEDPINRLDTGILVRNLYLADVTSGILFFLFGRNAKCLDYAGGHGILTRLLRDRGFDCAWHDKYAINVFARGFEYQDVVQGIGVVTCFEAFEHFPRPMEEIEQMLGISRNIIFSTELIPSSPPPPDQWWYYGLEHGQHVSFYSLRTLRFIAKTYNLNLLTNGKFVHMLTEKNKGARLFSILVGLSPYGLGKLPRLFMKSKTSHDMGLLSGRDRNRRFRQ
ncbi:MAG: methyltransferase domain-containing protein [Candidatus Deferrimicrobiaceae bacterium]